MSASRPRLTKGDLEAWRAHPVTEAVHRYLRDFAAHIRGQWAQGEDWTVEAKFQVHIMESLADLDLDSIETFYEPNEGDYEQASDEE